MQREALVVHMRVLVQVVNPVGVEQRGAAFDAVHCVAFVQQQFCQVSAVLAGHAGDQCSFHRVGRLVCVGGRAGKLTTISLNFRVAVPARKAGPLSKIVRIDPPDRWRTGGLLQ